MEFDHKRVAMKQTIEQALLDFLPEYDEQSNPLGDAIKYSLKAGGKRLRPMLLLSTAEYFGANIKDVLPYACAIEYIHTYSLIHDDLPSMDDDDYRRGMLSNHKVYGDAIATLAGDALLNRAMEIVCDDLLISLDDKNKMRKKIMASKEIFDASGSSGMIGGQAADMMCQGKNKGSDLLHYIHLKKTTAIIIASVKAGAILGNADDDQLEDFTKIATNVGFAFQIADDILDICGDESLIGKPIKSDGKSDKLTYPSIYGMEASQNKIESLHKEAYRILSKYKSMDFLDYLLKSLENRKF